MQDFRKAVARCGIGRTPQLCQDAMVEMLEELFEGKKYSGQDGKKALKIFKQDLPIPEDTDADVDTNQSPAPYIVVCMNGGTIQEEDKPQVIDMSLVICAYDSGPEREAYRDVANIKEDIVQRVCAKPYFGGTFTILKPIAWAMQEDDTHPYYYAAITLSCTAPAMSQETELKELL